MPKIERVDEHVQKPGPQNGAKNEVEAQIRQQMGVQTLFPGLAHGPGDTHQKGSRDKKSVCVQGEGAQLDSEENEGSYFKDGREHGGVSAGKRKQGERPRPR